MPTDNNYWGNPPEIKGSEPAQAPSDDGAVSAAPASAEPAAQGADFVSAQQPAVTAQTSFQTPETSQQATSAAQQNSQQTAPAAQQFGQQAAPTAQQFRQQAAPAAQPYNQSAAPAPAYAQQAPQAAAPYPYANAAQFEAQPPVQKKSHGWIVAIVVIVCLFLLSAFAIKSCSEALSTISPYGMGDAALTEDAVAIINVSGTIQYDGTACSPEGLKELLDEAEDDDHIKAVVLRVDSGGGTATAGEEMAEYVRLFNKPIVVSSASINASAAYEISSQSDYIFVAKSTEIGAIGTAMQLTDMSGLLDMLGINMEVITSAEQKDSSYGFRPLTDEERAYYQGLVDEINEVFVQNVADGRGMTIDEVKELATGMPFTGLGAVANGLADEVGTREDAVAKAAELAGVTEYTTIELDLSSYDLSSLSYLLGETNSSTDVLDGLLDSRAQ